MNPPALFWKISSLLNKFVKCVIKLIKDDELYADLCYLCRLENKECHIT